MSYPNVRFWSAMKSDCQVQVADDQSIALSRIDCGHLSLPSGKLIACDPFTCLDRNQDTFVTVPAGKYRVVVTLADVSDAKDGSHIREAYVTLLIDESASEIHRKIISPVAGDQTAPPEMSEDGIYFGFPVDAGTACLVDCQAVATCMPEGDWYDDLFENGSPECWFNRMDDPDHVRAGIANIELPLAKKGENIIIVHSGWGDGHYPVVGGYDSNGRLVRVHIDFMVVFDDRPQAGD